MKPDHLRNFLSHGAPDPLPVRTPLRAGPLTICFEAGDLRYIKLGEHEVIRRIYAAIRDRNWGTIPGVISKLEEKIGQESFEIRYQCEHRQNEIHFVWNAQITGNPEGSIHFIFDGEAKSTFLRNRIGFCVLHPIQCAGAKCRAIYANGSPRESHFPKIIAAEQPVTSLHDLSGLDHEIEPGVWAELRFDGDFFETEDQRNWIDASFKTFCTPLRLPFPVEVKAGTRIRQEVKLRVVGLPQNRGSSSDQNTNKEEVTVRLCDSVRALPLIGLCWTNRGEELSKIEGIRLSALNLAHFRVDVHASDPDPFIQLKRVCTDPHRPQVEIEMAVHLDEQRDKASPVAFLTGLRSQLESLACRPARVLAFGSTQDDSTPPEALAAVRSAFADLLVPIGAGTNADLYQLNLQRPPADADFIFWSMNPQVHAFDCNSIAETPEAAGQQVTSVRDYYPGKSLVVSPITLKPRFNPVATGPEKAPGAGELPPDVDPRQLSLFAAGWTLAMIKALAEAGAASVTLFETVGWRGVLETQTGSTCPEKFPSIPGTVFPLYHVLSFVGEFAGGEVVATKSSNPLAVASLLLRSRARRRLLLANLSAESRIVSFQGVGGAAFARAMDLSNGGPNRPSKFEGTNFKLGPYALATIELAEI